MKITSPIFDHGEKILKKYTCQGADVIPPLLFSDIPAQAKSLALIMDDPDAPAGTWVHWIVWNIPTNTNQIKEGKAPKSATVGKNSWGNNEYGGPCPPSGSHRYFFKLYALDDELELPSSTNKSKLEETIKKHKIEEAVLMGKYQKQ